MFIFSKIYKITSSQVEGGRLCHIALISLLQETRVAFLNKYGMQEDNIVTGIGIVIGELSIKFFAAAREDDVLKISIALNNLAEKKCTLSYEVKSMQENKIIATAKTEIVFIDLNQEKSIKIPEKFIKIAKPCALLPLSPIIQSKI